MYIVPDVILANRFTNTTILFFATGGISYGLVQDNPVTGLLPAGVDVWFAKPGTAPIALTIDGVNFRELGRGLYEYDIDGTLLDVTGLYAIEFVDPVTPGGVFIGYTVMLQIAGGLYSQLEKVLGFGNVVLSETYGGTVPDPKPLQIISGGQPLDFVKFYIFTEADWDADNRDIATYSKGIGQSDHLGDWQWPIVVQPDDYVIIADTSANTLFELLEIVRFTAAVPTTAPQPVITTVLPATGPQTGGTLIVITGTDFVDGTTVDVGGVAATSVSFISVTEIRAITPVGSAGAKDVKVTNPDTQYGVKSSAFTYV